jgi:peptide/nickel transport system substrate-binding protein
MSIPIAYAADAKHGGTLIIALHGESPDYKPITGSSFVNPILNDVYNKLFNLDWQMKPIPSLATSYEVSEDGLNFTVHLVKNATWHDGKPFTSADVVFNVSEIYPLHFRSGTFWKTVSAEAPDDYTVIFKLKEPYAPFISVLSDDSSGLYIMPKHLYEGTDIKNNPYNKKPVGTGPFKFKEWVKGERIELIRNENYFAAGKEKKPYIDRVVFSFMPDPSSRNIAIKKGDVDYLPSFSVSTDAIPDFEKDPKLTVDRNPHASMGMHWLFFNLRNPILSKKLVRQAIAHAIDKDQIYKLALGGVATIAKSIVNSGAVWAFNPKIKEYSYDIQKANAMLDEAGYPKGADGIRFKQRLLCLPTRGNDGPVAEIIKNQLKQVGIDIEMVGMDQTAFNETMFLKWDFDMSLQQGATAPDPAVGGQRFIHSKQIQKALYVNASGFSNPEVDRLLDEEVKIQNIDKRAAMWYQIQDIFIEELPMIPIWEDIDVSVNRSEWVDLITGRSQTRENVYKK